MNRMVTRAVFNRIRYIKLWCVVLFGMLLTLSLMSIECDVSEVKIRCSQRDFQKMVKH